EGYTPYRIASWSTDALPASNCRTASRRSSALRRPGLPRRTSGESEVVSTAVPISDAEEGDDASCFWCLRLMRLFLPAPPGDYRVRGCQPGQREHRSRGAAPCPAR